VIYETSLIWKQIAKTWENYFSPPSRPSKGEVLQYNKWLMDIKGKNLKGLVLGATPELRDALFENNFKAYLIDINMEMIMAMGGLVKNQNPQEIIVKSNWLDNPLQEKYFDVILGDAVIPNVPWEKRGEFLKEIKRILKPKGYFLNRAFHVPEVKPYKKIEELLESFANKKASNKTALEMVFEIQIFTHTPNDYQGSNEKVYEVVEKLRGKDGFNYKSKELNKTLDIVWDYWLTTARKKVWLYNYQKQEEAEYKKYFKIIKRFNATDHPYGKLTSMYLMQRK